MTIDSKPGLLFLARESNTIDAAATEATPLEELK